MLSVMTVEGVKSFKSEAEVTFAPITVLTGTNSSGKSTVFQILLALKQTFEMPPPRSAGVSLNGEYVALGSYEDLSSEHKSGPVRITLGLTCSPHAPSSGGLQSGFRPWWVPEWRDLRKVVNDRVNARLELHLERSETSATVARLKRFHWVSFNSDRGEQRQVYALCISQEAPAEEEITPAPTLNNDPPSPADFPYRIDLKRDTTEERGVAERARPGDTLNSARTTVSGLVPAVILKPTNEQAVFHTLTSVLAECVNLIREGLGEMTPSRSRFKPQSHIPGPDPIRSKLSRTGEFLQRCTSADFLDFLVHYSQFCQDVVDAIKEQIVRHSYPSNPAADIDIARHSLTQLQRLLNESIKIPKQPAIVPADQQIEVVLSALSEQMPPLAPLIELIRSVLGREFDELVLKRLRDMVMRAATEQRRQAKLLTPVPALSWLEGSRYSYRSERDYPTEQELKAYFTECLFHLGPLREEPKNLYASDLPVSMADVGKRGERAIACLRAFGTESVLLPPVEAQRFEKRFISLASAVTEWGRFLGIYEAIEVNAETKYGTVCRVATDTSSDPVRADLTNVGVGVSQLLPVVVLCLAAPPGSTVLIEQPELHLHPAVQTRLAEFFLACALTGRQIVVETHSEHLVNGLRLLASEGRLVPKRDVALSFIERDEFGSQVTPVTIGGDGSIDRWPAHFFDETEQVLSRIMRNKMGKE